MVIVLEECLELTGMVVGSTTLIRKPSLILLRFRKETNWKMLIGKSFGDHGITK